MIKFEDFTKLDIRIATVVVAERADGSDRLLKITIDLGIEKRQIVAGFGHLHTPEELVGKQVPVIINIEPTKIRGIESHGILLALDDASATLISPITQVANGVKIK